MGRPPIRKTRGAYSPAERQARRRARLRAERRAAEIAAEREPVHPAIVLTDGGPVGDLATLIRDGMKFGTVYADSPWQFDNQGTRAATRNHYVGMTVAELCALPISKLVAANCHLHMWVPNGFLFDCPRIFAAWGGFEFKSTLIWTKPQMGIGNYWRNSHEIMLTAVRGDAKRFNDHSMKSWVLADRAKHSAKPAAVRSFIERASPGPYLELFGRAQAPGWFVYGNHLTRKSKT